MDPDTLRDDQWQAFVEVYVNDKYKLDMKKFFEKNNPDALAQISERFLEAIRKGYFKTDEKTVKKLVETYMETANAHDVYTENETFKMFVKAKAAGFGLKTNLPVKVQAKFKTVPMIQKSVLQIKGQALQEVKKESSKEDYSYLYFAMAILLVIIAGAAYEIRRSRV